MDDHIFRNISIRTRISVLLILSIIILSSALLYVSKRFTQSIIENYLYDYLEITQQEMGKGIELLIDDVNILSVRLLTSDGIYSAILDPKISKKDKEKHFRTLLDEMLINRQEIGDIVIVTNDGEMYDYASPGDLMDKPDERYLEKIRQSPELIEWGGVKKDKNNNAYVLLGKKYRNFYTGQSLGYLILYIRESAIYDIYKKNIPDMGYSFLLSDDNYIISHPDKNKVGSMIYDSDKFSSEKVFEHFSSNMDGKPSIMAISKFYEQLQRLGCNWKIVSVIPQDKLFELMDRINTYVFIIEIIMSLAAILISIKISSQIVGPIKLLQDKLKDFGKNNVISLSFFEKTGNEIWELEKTYNEMVKRISDLIIKNNEEKEKQRELELIALQAQINPHFLYNTLDAIGWISKLKRQPEIEKLVMALARFFRISLHKGDKFITVQEEIELVRNYVTIELIRFPDKFDLDIDVDEDVLYCRILKLTLQPLVENAIKHGIGAKEGKGLIKITGRRVDDDIHLEVIDDGVGFDVDKKSFKGKDENKEGGYGLNNVDKRIKLEYGEDYGIKIFSLENVGTRIEVKLKADLDYLESE